MIVESALRWLRPPTFPDTAKTRQATILWGLLWSFLVLSLPILLFLDPARASFQSLLICDAFLVALLIMTRQGLIFPSTIILPTSLLVLVTYINIRSDGVHDAAVVAYMLVISIAGLLIGTRGLIIFTMITVASYTIIAVAEINGVLVNDFSYKTTLGDIIIFAAICSAFAILLRVTLQYLLDNLERAEAGERAIAERNLHLERSRSEIERLNTDLESRIAERTAALQSATQENERLFNISRDVNSAQDYIELVDAIAPHLDHTEYGVTLAVFDTQDRQTAHYISVVAQRATRHTQTSAIHGDHYSADYMRRMVNIPQVLVVDDVHNPPTDMPADMINELDLLGAGSFMMTELRIKNRILGYLLLGLPYAHEFSAHDIRVIRAAGELAAAAVERMRLYSEQVDVAVRLRDADEVKSRFMANMSHELRTPLNAILNFTRFVSSGMLGTINAEQLDALNKTISSSKHLLSLINDVLDVTKIESQMLTLFVEANVDLNAEIDAAIHAGEALIGTKPVTIVADVTPDLPPVVGDRRRLRQVLLNLVSNACKFTETGTVTVSAHRVGSQIKMAISDTGPGIADEDKEAIFEPFRQSKRGLSMSGGTGLGLAIARRLVEAHQGMLTVNSTPGEGASFTIVIPIESGVLSSQIEVMEIQP